MLLPSDPNLPSSLISDSKHVSSSEISSRFSHLPLQLPTTQVIRSLQQTPNESLKASSSTSVASSSSSSITLISTALLLHSSIFILILLLQRFSPSQTLNTQYLTVLFALTIPILGLIFFLLNQQLSLQSLALQQHGTSFAIFFVLDHAAIELLTSLSILLPVSLVHKRPGLVILGVWVSLCLISVGASLSPEYYFADVIAWTTFVSDTVLAVCGASLVMKWARGADKEEQGRKSDELQKTAGSHAWRWKCVAEDANQDGGVEKTRQTDKVGAANAWNRKVQAGGLAGLGFIIHGISALPVPPIWTYVSYHGLKSTFLTNSCVAALACSFLTMALSLPTATLLFSSSSRISCGQARKTTQGTNSAVEPGPHSINTGGTPLVPTFAFHNRSISTPEPPPKLNDSHFAKNGSFSNWFSFSGPSGTTGSAQSSGIDTKKSSPDTDAMDQWEKLQQQYIATQTQALASVKGTFSEPSSRRASMSGALHSRNGSIASISNQHTGGYPNVYTDGGVYGGSVTHLDHSRSGSGASASLLSAGVGSSTTTAVSGNDSQADWMINAGHIARQGHARSATQDSGFSTHTTTYLPAMPELSPPPPVPHSVIPAGNAFSQMQHLQLSQPSWLFPQHPPPVVTLDTDLADARSHVRSNIHSAPTPTLASSSAYSPFIDTERRQDQKHSRSQTQVRPHHRRGSSLARLASIEQHIQNQLAIQHAEQENAQREIHQLLDRPLTGSMSRPDRVMSAHRRIFGSGGSAHRRIFGSDDRTRGLETVNAGDFSTGAEAGREKRRKNSESEEDRTWSSRSELERERAHDAIEIGVDGRVSTEIASRSGTGVKPLPPAGGLGLFPPISPSGYWTSLAAKYGARGEFGPIDRGKGR